MDTPAAIIRQLGLTARGAGSGLVAIPSMLWNGPVNAVNQLTGAKIPLADIGPAMNALGLPRPENATERVAQGAVGAMTGAGGVASLGAKLAQRIEPGLGQAIAALFGAAPGAQIVSSAASAGAEGAAREAGVGEVGQLAAGIGAGALPVVGPMMSARGAFSKKLDQTGEGSWGPVYGNLTGDTDNAVAHLLRAKQGAVPAALTHPDVPEGITLPYGAYDRAADKGAGVAKLADKHAETLQDLQGFLSSMEKNAEASGRGRILLKEGDERRAVVALNHSGMKSEPWLLTAYQKQSPARGRALASDTSADTIGLSRRGDTARPTGHVSIDEYLAQNPGARDPRQYVGILPPEEAAARRQALEQRLRAALFGTSIGFANEGQ
ncbi:hypothetical protein [Bordetella avium]|uniref:hypothetical protein n=1 Tax=Bordetella avium TaxID=521 RepID=UPI00057AF3A7|nr:hypothetical protein [Bordetella avium]